MKSDSHNGHIFFQKGNVILLCLWLWLAMVMSSWNFIIAQLTNCNCYLQAKLNIPIPYRHRQRVWRCYTCYVLRVTLTGQMDLSVLLQLGEPAQHLFSRLALLGKVFIGSVPLNNLLEQANLSYCRWGLVCLCKGPLSYAASFQIPIN